MTEEINYNKVINDHSWIIEKNQQAILSPDVDGFLCGLLMSNYLDWKIVGFYDGKSLLLKKGLSTKDCVFLDMEILRKNIHSLGHHMNIHDLNRPPQNYHKLMENCINPNYIREFDRKNNFQQKYPLGSIHLLLYILEVKYPNMIKIKEESLGSLFFADGTWKVLFNYTNNVLDWFNYLHTEKESVWWKKLKALPVIDLIKEVNVLLKNFKTINSDKKNQYGHIDISDMVHQKTALINILDVLSDSIGWKYIPDKWGIDTLKEYKFTKGIHEGSKSNKNFLKIFNKKPLSLSMTASSRIEYTLEKPDKLP